MHGSRINSDGDNKFDFMFAEMYKILTNEVKKLA